MASSSPAARLASVSTAEILAQRIAFLALELEEILERRDELSRPTRMALLALAGIIADNLEPDELAGQASGPEHTGP